MANQWFRLYAEFAHDPKVQMLSEVDQRRYIMLLCMRCNGDVTLHETEIAFQLRITDEQWAETRARLLQRKLITKDNNPAAWEKRQYASDSSVERVRRHRDKVRNGDVTLQKRPSNAVDTDTDTDTEVNPISPKGDTSTATAADPVDNFLEIVPKVNGNHAPICPHQAILDLYHEKLPQLVPVRVWNETRRRHLQSLWRGKAAELKWKSAADGIEWFDAYFHFVGQSEFLTGKATGNGDRRPFIADLEWIIKPANFAKVIEGKYHA